MYIVHTAQKEYLPAIEYNTQHNYDGNKINRYILDDTLKTKFNSFFNYLERVFFERDTLSFNLSFDKYVQ
jgi:hypothetical protein